MIDVVERGISALVVSCILCLSTVKLLGAMQQGGYQNKNFWRWLKRKDNLAFNRLAVLSLCLALSTAIVSLCFSFLGSKWGVVCSSVPFFALLLFYAIADGKYALKVRPKRTGRFCRLFGIYYFFTALFAYVLIALLAFLAEWNGSSLYGLIAYVPVAILPVTLPVWVSVANAVTGVFENARNRKFVRRAGHVLDECKITRIAVVGSYGKTSVKNILKTLLSERYSVVETPASYNTPVGIAKTVFSEAFTGKQIFIAEMGARKRGDIAELCALVKPDYAIFTGVCPQHVATFGSEEEIFAEKSEILRVGAKIIVCGESLRSKIKESERADGENPSDKTEGRILFADGEREVRLLGDKTAFTLSLGGERVTVETKLLGRAAAENIALAATLCYELGMKKEEILRGIEKLQPIPHRLQLLESNGVNILDDGYNANIRGAQAALEVLSSFGGRKCVVTPGIVEGGILEETLNGELGRLLAEGGFDRVILVGETLIGEIKEAYKAGGGDMEKLTCVPTLSKAQTILSEWVEKGDTVLFLNDLPDVY